MPKVFTCSDSEKTYQTGRGLRKHFQTYPGHKREETFRRPPLQPAVAANNFLDEFFKSSLMPVVFKKNFNQFVQFADGLVSNFDIFYTKYQNIVRNQLDKDWNKFLESISWYQKMTCVKSSARKFVTKFY